jgi:inward rectifier potassium channel
MRISTFRAKKGKPEEPNDLGFGNKTIGSERLINRNGGYNVVRKGRSIWTPYQNLVEMSWGQFFVLVFTFYFVVNLLFATVFFLIGADQFNGVNAETGMSSFFDLFFFSAQTLTTVGYGFLSPKGMLANAVASVEALLGLMVFALATGLLFARFSRPKAKIAFSKNALISPYKEGKALMFRIANLRNNNLINLEVRITMAWIEIVNGVRHRRFAPLVLERDKVVLFPLNWTIVHPIDENSPLYQKEGQDLTDMQPEIVILISGYDETFAQNVHTNSSYAASDLVCNAKFSPMYFEKDGHITLQLDLIDEYEVMTA